MAPGGRCVWPAGVPAAGTLEDSSGNPAISVWPAFPTGLPLPYPSLSFSIGASPSCLGFLPTLALAPNLDNGARPGHPIPRPSLEDCRTPLS